MTISQPRISTRHFKRTSPTIDDLASHFREVVAQSERHIEIIREQMNHPDLRCHPLNRAIAAARIAELYQQMYRLADFINFALKRDTR